MAPKHAIQERTFGRPQPLRHARAKPGIHVQMKNLFRLAQPLKTIALRGVEQSRHIEPGHRPQRSARMKIGVEAVLPEELGEQSCT